MNDYIEYLDRFCRSRGISREEAETFAIVKDIKAYYLQLEAEDSQKVKV